MGIVTQRRSDMDTYLAWLDETPLDEIPPGEDVSDLGALGETRCTNFSREEIIRRVAFARGRGRSWHTSPLTLAPRRTLRADSTGARARKTALRL